MGGVVVEGAGVDVGAGGAGDLDGGVGGVGVEDVNVVGPGDAGEASGRSCCSLRVRMRTEIICWLWYPVMPMRTISVEF